MPSSFAIAGRWIRPLVEPPIALCTIIALRKACGVRMSIGRIFRLTSSIIVRPALLAKNCSSLIVAGTSALPGSASPSASAIHCIVLAVPIKVQAPTDGQPVRL